MNAVLTVHRFTRFLAIGLCFLISSAAIASEPGMFAANEVSQASLYDYMDNWLYTHVGDNRGVGGPEHDLCRDNIAALMQSYDLSVTIEPFSYQSNTYHNVVGTKVGTLYPTREYVIGAHYDSVNNPGADDNASGVALVLECASIITQYNSDYTIRFIAFSREEQGLIGSHAYVQQHFGDDIWGMIAADMVAFDTDTDNARIYQRDNSPVAIALGSSVNEYGDGLTWQDPGWISASDHASFDNAGYDACLLIEGQVWHNPWYHTQQDSFEQPGNLIFPYMTKMTRAAVGCLVDLAGVQVAADYLDFTYPAGRPEYVAPAGGTTIRVEVAGVGNAVPQPNTGTLHYDAGFGWESTPLFELAPNVYDAVMPASECGYSVQYYFSAQAVGGEVFTDPHNAPGVVYSAMSAYGRTVRYDEPLNNDPGWNTQGEWAFGQPSGLGGDAYGYPDPTGGATGTNVYGVNLAGDYDVTTPGGPYYLTLGPIDLTGAHATCLDFQRWLNSDYQPYVSAMVEVSADGTNWIELWANGSSEVTDDAWLPTTYDISAVADDKPAVYIRWGYEVGDAAWAYSGWNVDDVVITALACTPLTCPGDSNCDASISWRDIDFFVAAMNDNVTAWEAMFLPAAPTCTFDNNDVNADGAVNWHDIDPLVALMNTTCP